MSNPTFKTDPASIKAFIEKVENKRRREDGFTLLDIFREVTGEKPVLLCPTIIGFGRHQYDLASGKTGTSINVGFSPRKANLVLYVMGSVGADHSLVKNIGKCRTSKACLYVNKLADIDLDVLRKIIDLSYTKTIEKYGTYPLP